MAELFLSEDILSTVENPARYIGQEKNAVIKDPDNVRVRFAMCFPDVYEIGMSHLGIQIIYEQLNRREDTWCERVYSPWPDLSDIMKERGIPLFALESQQPVSGFDFLGITLQYELCYTNVLQVLDLAGIPFYAKDRTWDHPIVMGGGPCTYNPEPIADFFDLFYIGESEDGMSEMIDDYLICREKGLSREETLAYMGKRPGVYCPLFYEPSYGSDGLLAGFEPVRDDMPRVIKRVIQKDMDKGPYPERPLVPYVKPAQDRVGMEIQRGCIRGCRFCQAGFVYRPLRERSLEECEMICDTMLASTGQEEISLCSLSSSDYSSLPELLDYLIEYGKKKKVNISLPSLRIDNFSLDVMGKVQDVRKSSLTFAPEAGTQHLRNVINKGLSEDDILGGALLAFKLGWSKVKYYFMLGLPLEREEDRKGIAHLAQKTCEVYYDGIPKEQRTCKCDITVSTSFFVPKPFTPFQWARMYMPEDYISYAKTVKEEIRQMKNQRSIHYKWHDPDGTLLEGVLARGDRRVAKVILKAYEKGAFFDAWTERFRIDIWNEAFRETGVDIAFYTQRERADDELFPWDFIDIGVTREFMLREWHRAKEEKVTPNCRVSCSGCGIKQAYDCGVCTEKRIDQGRVFGTKASLDRLEEEKTRRESL